MIDDFRGCGSKQVGEEQRWTPDDISRHFEAVKARMETERRAQFLPFGISADCLWPCSRLYHLQSSLGPAWKAALSAEEVERLTKNQEYKHYPGTERTLLPAAPRLSAGLEQTIRSRRSVSNFSTRQVTLLELAKLLELASGITATGEVSRRAAPSGGALYPVETYALAFAVEGIHPGLYHYVARDHALEHVRPITGIETLKSFLYPKLVESRPALLLAFSAVFARIQMKYLERGYRFALLEAGHIAQNALLTANALGLGAVSVGGFWDEPFNDVLGFDPAEEAVVYSILLGHTEGDTGAELAAN